MPACSFKTPFKSEPNTDAQIMSNVARSKSSSTENGRPRAMAVLVLSSSTSSNAYLCILGAATRRRKSVLIVSAHSRRCALHAHVVCFRMLECLKNGLKAPTVEGARSNSLVRVARMSSTSRSSSRKMNGREKGRRKTWMRGELSLRHCAMPKCAGSWPDWMNLTKSGTSPRRRLAACLL